MVEEKKEEKDNFFEMIEDYHTNKTTKEDLIEFYNEYRCILPESITRWENLFS